MAGRIVTARHGRPHVDRSVKITAQEYGAWWMNYDLAGLAPDQEPPKELIQAAADCDVVLSSTLPRAIETAARVVDGAKLVPKDEIFVEAPLPPPPVAWIKLTPTTWGVISRAFWFWGFSPNGCESRPETKIRVKAAADLLINHAEQGNNVLLCAHGYFNWMLDRHMVTRGWAKTDHFGGNNYWSHRTYRQAPAKERPAPSARLETS